MHWSSGLVDRESGASSRCIAATIGETTEGDQEDQVAVNNGRANLSGPPLNETLSILSELHVVLERES